MNEFEAAIIGDEVPLEQLQVRNNHELLCDALT